MNAQLSSYVAAYRSSATAESELSAGNPRTGALPFEDAFAPMRDFADLELPVDGRLSAAARRDVLRDLVRQFSEMFASPLLDRFSRVRQGDGAGRAHYRAFVREMWSGGWSALFRRLPEVERISTELVQKKVAETTLMLERLENDRLELGLRLGGDPGAIDSIRTVKSTAGTSTVVGFSSGASVVYQPWNLQVRKAWGKLLRWLNGRFSLSVVAPWTLARADYGWSRFVASAPCTDPASLRRYSRRVGSLLALLDAIQGTERRLDEPMTAAGEQPVLLDCEGILEDARQPETGIEWQAVNIDGMAKQAVAVTRSLPVNMYVEEVEAGFSETHRLLVEYSVELMTDDGPFVVFRSRFKRFFQKNTRAYRTAPIADDTRAYSVLVAG